MQQSYGNRYVLKFMNGISLLGALCHKSINKYFLIKTFRSWLDRFKPTIKTIFWVKPVKNYLIINKYLFIYLWLNPQHTDFAIIFGRDRLFWATKLTIWKCAIGSTMSENLRALELKFRFPKTMFTWRDKCVSRVRPIFCK